MFYCILVSTSYTMILSRLDANVTSHVKFQDSQIMYLFNIYYIHIHFSEGLVKIRNLDIRTMNMFLKCWLDIFVELENKGKMLSGRKSK